MPAALFGRDGGAELLVVEFARGGGAGDGPSSRQLAGLAGTEQVGDGTGDLRVVGQTAVRFVNVVGAGPVQLRERQRHCAVARSAFGVDELVIAQLQTGDRFLVDPGDEMKAVVRRGELVRQLARGAEQRGHRLRAVGRPDDRIEQVEGRELPG